MEKIRLLAVIFSLFNYADSATVGTSCDVPSVGLGENLTITCFLSYRHLNDPAAIDIRLNGSLHVLCNPILRGTEMYSCQNIITQTTIELPISTQLTLTLTKASSESVGTYVCKQKIADPKGDPLFKNCTFSLKDIDNIRTSNSRDQWYFFFIAIIPISIIVLFCIFCKMTPPPYTDGKKQKEVDAKIRLGRYCFLVTQGYFQNLCQTQKDDKDGNAEKRKFIQSDSKNSVNHLSIDVVDSELEEDATAEQGETLAVNPSSKIDAEVQVQVGFDDTEHSTAKGGAQSEASITGTPENISSPDSKSKPLLRDPKYASDSSTFHNKQMGSAIPTSKTRVTPVPDNDSNTEIAMSLYDLQASPEDSASKLEVFCRRLGSSLCKMQYAKTENEADSLIRELEELRDTMHVAQEIVKKTSGNTNISDKPLQQDKKGNKAAASGVLAEFSDLIAKIATAISALHSIRDCYRLARIQRDMCIKRLQQINPKEATKAIAIMKLVSMTLDDLDREINYFQRFEIRAETIQCDDTVKRNVNDCARTLKKMKKLINKAAVAEEDAKHAMRNGYSDEEVTEDMPDENQLHSRNGEVRVKERDLMEGLGRKWEIPFDRRQLSYNADINVKYDVLSATPIQPNEKTEASALCSQIPVCSRGFSDAHSFCKEEADPSETNLTSMLSTVTTDNYSQTTLNRKAENAVSVDNTNYDERLSLQYQRKAAETNVGAPLYSTLEGPQIHGGPSRNIANTHNDPVPGKQSHLETSETPTKHNPSDNDSQINHLSSRSCEAIVSSVANQTAVADEYISQVHTAAVTENGFEEGHERIGAMEKGKNACDKLTFLNAFMNGCKIAGVKLAIEEKDLPDTIKAELEKNRQFYATYSSVDIVCNDFLKIITQSSYSREHISIISDALCNAIGINILVKMGTDDWSFRPRKLPEAVRISVTIVWPCLDPIVVANPYKELVNPVLSNPANEITKM